MFLFVAAVFWSVDLWDLDTHRALTAQLLHGNLPPRALNDPRFPLAYHAVYDALVAIVVTVLPIDLQPAMGMVSTACVALTLANLQALSRVFFRRRASAQLARALFMFGFGPVFIRCVASGWNLAEMHGRTAQSYVELILRRPAGLGMAFFTLALAVVLPCYGRGASREAAISRLKWLVPTLLVLPQMSEEATFFLFVYLTPLVLARRLSARTVAVLVAATVVGALQSGVVLGVLGHRSMATPTLHLSFPPRLPTWAFEQTGVSLFSREAGGFYSLELGPVFLAALAFALIGRDAGRRAVGGAFLAGARDRRVRQHRSLEEERPRPVSVLRNAARVHAGRGAARPHLRGGSRRASGARLPAGGLRTGRLRADDHLSGLAGRQSADWRVLRARHRR